MIASKFCVGWLSDIITTIVNCCTYEKIINLIINKGNRDEATVWNHFLSIGLALQPYNTLQNNLTIKLKV